MGPYSATENPPNSAGQKLLPSKDSAATNGRNQHSNGDARGGNKSPRFASGGGTESIYCCCKVGRAKKDVRTGNVLGNMRMPIFEMKSARTIRSRFCIHRDSLLRFRVYSSLPDCLAVSTTTFTDSSLYQAFVTQPSLHASSFISRNFKLPHRYHTSELRCWKALITIRSPLLDWHIFYFPVRTAHYYLMCKSRMSGGR